MENDGSPQVLSLSVDEDGEVLVMREDEDGNRERYKYLGSVFDGSVFDECPDSLEMELELQVDLFRDAERGERDYREEVCHTWETCRGVLK